MKIVRPIAITDAIFTSSTVLENDYAAWSAVTAYVVGDRVIRTSTHKVYESIQNGTNKIPESEPTFWVEVSPTNKWKMFDESPSTQTSRADSIEVVLAMSQLFDTIALLGVAADTVRVQIAVPGEGTVYDETVDMLDESGIVDWWAWFFYPIRRKSYVIFENLPPYPESTVTITLTDTGSTALCGVCVLGLGEELGDTQWSPRRGIRDYSVKKVDDFGAYQIVERAFAKKGDFTLEVPNAIVDYVVERLEEIRAVAVVWIGTSLYGSTIVYGFYWDFEVDIKYPTKSICSLSVEGLT